MKRKFAALAHASIIFLFSALSGCSTVMEVERPDPVDTKQFVVGEDRIKVLAEIGAPITTTPNGDQSCDIYKLYTRGPGAVEKGAIAAGEAVVDVFTLGLSEIAFTPAEAATKNSKHTVLFCYGPDKKLASVAESDSHVDN